MDEQSKNQTSTDPSTVSMPPAEGRTDVGEADAQQLPADQAANAATSQPDQRVSKQASEGRPDIAQDLAQEQEQSYTASRSRAPDPSSTQDAGTQQAPAAKPED
jgi:hypothetical protein